MEKGLAGCVIRTETSAVDWYVIEKIVLPEENWETNETAYLVVNQHGDIKTCKATKLSKIITINADITVFLRKH